MTDARELLSALIDRELVDPEELARVLDEPEGRALLVDFVRLRAAVAAEDQQSAERTGGRTGGKRLLFVTESARFHLNLRRAGRVAAMLVLLVAAAGGGFWAGARLSDDVPPAASRVIRFEPGLDWNQLQPGASGGLGR
jgi:hypothetical protein